MKISPIPNGGTPGVNLSNPNQVTPQNDPQVDRARTDIKKIKMRTNASPNRFETASKEEEATESSAEEVSAGAKTDTDVPAQVVEDTKPLSPQYAALAKEKRAIQRERMELETKRKELEQSTSMNGADELISKLKTQPLSVLQEYGVTYDQLTEAILSQSDGINPEIQKLKEEIKALKEGVDSKFSERDTRAEEQVLTEMLGEAELLAKEGDDFSLIKDEGESAYEEVLRRIYSTYRKTGQVLEVREVMQKLEDEFLEKRLKYAQHTKVKSRLTPPQEQPVQQPKQNYMKTLTNRDSASMGLSRKERAILAMRGQLNK